MSLKSLQTKIGITADGAWGPGTFKVAMAFYKLSSVRAAHFFAQTAHETGGFKTFVENLNYSAKKLRDVFGKYFPSDAVAAQYEKKPEKIANRVYASRMGNGSEASGDGWRYRGRGALQLTGKDNYKAFADYCKRPDVMSNPDIVATELAFESAMFFFERNKLWSICDRGVTDAAILSLTKKINGGTHGLADRSDKTKKYIEWATSSTPAAAPVTNVVAKPASEQPAPAISSVTPDM
jgi:putative chitinase